MAGALEEAAVSRIAVNLQKMGWMVGRAYDNKYDLLAYSPKHYRICGIQVVVFDVGNTGREISLEHRLENQYQGGCTHIAVYIEPKGWIYIAPKEKIIAPDGCIRSVLSPGGTPLDGKENPASFGAFLETWEELLC